MNKLAFSIGLAVLLVAACGKKDDNDQNNPTPANQPAGSTSAGAPPPAGMTTIGPNPSGSVSTTPTEQPATEPPADESATPPSGN